MLKAKQSLLSCDQPLLIAAVERVASGLPPDKSGAIRTQHLGILLSIIVISGAGERATIQAIGHLTGMHISHVSKIAGKLFELGVVEREKTVASHGRGYQYCFHPIMNLSQLVSDLNAAGNKRGRG